MGASEITRAQLWAEPKGPSLSTYRPDVDGLRALAVIAVVLFHAGVPGISGGFAGVDVFFVISGYLITSHILHDIDNRKFSIFRFYERRIRRIFPALFVVVFLSGLAAWFVLLPPDFISYAESALATALFASNIYFWKASGYFAAGAQLKPLLHTWSLGVEEQFYIVVPIIIVLSAKFSRKLFAPLFLCATAFSFVVSVWGTRHAPTASYFLLPSRFWEIGIGSLLAGMPIPRLPRTYLNLSGLFGLSIIVGSFIFLSEGLPFPGINAIYPCFGAAILIYSHDKSCISYRILGCPPLVFVGKISYSLYLWHWPVLSLLRYQLGGEIAAWERAAAILVASVFAYGSWRWVEQPVRLDAVTFNRSIVFAGAGGCVCATLLAAISVIGAGGVGTRFPGFAMQTVPGKEQYREGTCFMDERQAMDDWKGSECYLTHGHTGRTLLWGDSFAAHYAPGITAQSDRINSDILEYTASSCPPLLDYNGGGRANCQVFNGKVLDLIRRYRISTVVMSARWESYFRLGAALPIAETVEKLQHLGLRVYVIGQSPVFGNNVQILFGQARGGRGVDREFAPLAVDSAINARMEASLPNGVFIDPLPTFCEGARCEYRRAGEFLTIDIGHFSAAGSKLAVAGYFPEFESRSPPP